MQWSRSFYKTILGIFLGILVLLGVSRPVDASLFIAMSAEELIEESDAVIEGGVIEQHSHWDEQGRVIVTDSTVRVSEVIIGQAPTFVRVRTYGGTVGNFSVDAQGFPQLNMGEEVVLFLKKDEAIHANRIVGYQQGHFEVVERLDGVVLAVPRIEDNSGLLTTSGQHVPVPSSTELGSFKKWVRAEAMRLGRATN
jgi:hypothetical protein